MYCEFTSFHITHSAIHSLSSSIHPLSLLIIRQGHGEAGARGGVRCRAFTETNTQSFTSMGNLEYPVDRICISLTCGRKPDDMDETHSGTARTCKLQTCKNREPSCGEATALTTAPQLHRCY